MKRLQILIEEELDEALGREARREGTSKGALIRRFVRERVQTRRELRDDPLWAFVGKSRGRRDDSRSVDDVVYPR